MAPVQANPGARPIHPEVLFGQLMVEQGWAAPEEVEECLRLRVHLAFAGVDPLPSLGELLVQKGYLTVERFRMSALWMGIDIPRRFGFRDPPPVRSNPEEGYSFHVKGGVPKTSSLLVPGRDAATTNLPS